jgi:gliding motility-associated-like protein
MKLSFSAMLVNTMHIFIQILMVANTQVRFIKALFIVSLISTMSFGQTFTVDDLGDVPDNVPGDGICETAGGVCTLRAAIEEANAQVGVNTINFAIPLSGQTINIDQALVITGTDGLTINGDINGDLLPDIIIRGNVFDINGFEITSKDNVLLHLNLINFGRVISGVPNTAILIDGPSATNNTVAGCYIGTDLTGLIDGGLYDNLHGIRIENGASGNIIGDGTEGYNVISNSGSHAVVIDNSAGNQISASYIGLGSDGTTFLVNSGTGVLINNSDDTQIGDLVYKNCISTNSLGGIEVINSPNTIVINNNIGTDINGIWALGNTGFGIAVQLGSTGTQIGQAIAGAGNVISANTYGIEIYSSDINVLNNTIGLNPAGDLALANSTGIRVNDLVTNINIGDGTLNGRNVISGNSNSGIEVKGQTTILGNYIGLSSDGTQEIGNNGNGIYIWAGDATEIGDGTLAGANIISGNGSNGVLISGATTGNAVHYNFIGTTPSNDPFGNTLSGIRLEAGATGNSAPQNIIAYNQTGILATGATTELNFWSQNLIYSNSDKGISLLLNAQGNVVPPTITNVLANGMVSGTSGNNALVEIYADIADQGEYLFGIATADGSGDWTCTCLGPVSSIPPGLNFITATQTTEPLISNSSEFSNPFAIPVTSIIGGVIDKDYNALVALYNATDGANWLTNTNWLTASPVSTWFGVSSSGNRVIQVDLNDNNLVGTLPPEIGMLNAVLNFRLRGNSISGTIPSETGNMSSLRQLWFYQNQLTGSIPSELGNLSQLRELRLDDNQLTGAIPNELGDITGLWLMYLYTNQLTGSIPITSTNFVSLRELDLKNNMLSGSLPSAIGDHTIITTLLLGDNQLTGSIPPELGNLTNLLYLQLHNNQFSGSIPVELGSLSNVLHFYLFNNQLTGSIPVELGSLSSVTGLRLHLNQLTGSIPIELGNLSTLQTLELYSNQLTGSIPIELGSLTNLTSLRLFSNQLNGSIPAELGNLSNILDFRLEDNLLTGSIPSALGNLSTMTDLRLHTNQLSGSIPPELGNLTNLTILYIYINQLTGAIPAELGTMTSLSSLFLFSNQLDGTIPVEIGNLNNLTSFRFDDNQLSGDVPVEMASMTSLTNLVFHNNQLNNLPDFSAITGITQFTTEDNNFEFDDIEPNVGISGFTYSPQALIPGPGNLSFATGDLIDISIAVGGSMNQYQWVKDGVDLTGETTDNLNFPIANSTDAGTYYLRITSSLVPGLTLQSEDIIINITNSNINVFLGNDNSGIPITDGQIIAADFGSAVVGTDIDQTFAIENTGISILNISSISLTGDSQFSSLGVIPTSVDPGATVTFGIRLSGTGVGTFTGTVLIDNDEGIFDFPVSGAITLTPEPEISVYTGPDNTGTPISDGQIIAIDIGSNPQGTDLDQVFAIENQGATDLVISSINLGSTDFSVITPVPFTVSPGLTSNFTIRLSSQNAGSFNDNVVINSNDTDEPTFVFPITGTIEPTEIIIHEGPDTSSPVIENGQPNSVDVGTTPQGTDLDKEFVISNTGSSDLNILSITTDQPAEFSILNPPTTIAPGSFAEFLIRLNAQQPGVYNGNVTISTDAGDITFPVTGEVLLLAENPTITVFNAVTPNGDDRHDFLRIENIEAYPGNEVIIFTKLGEQVFKISDYNNSDSEARFEGYSNVKDNNLLPEGTYYYVIKYTNLTDNVSKKKSGFIVMGM